MNITCTATNGTYRCELDAHHLHRHRSVEVVYDSQGRPSGYEVHRWVNAFTPVRTTHI